MVSILAPGHAVKKGGKAGFHGSSWCSIRTDDAAEYGGRLANHARHPYPTRAPLAHTFAAHFITTPQQ